MKRVECNQSSPEPPAHDAITRLLHRLEPNADELWEEARELVKFIGGILVVDDSVLDKLYAKKMELVNWQWSGKHGRVVKGINLTTLLWTDGDKHIPCDYQLYEKAVDGATKNDHFRTMLRTARERGFAPKCVAFDSWCGMHSRFPAGIRFQPGREFSALDNLKLIRSYGWIWLTRLKRNRLVNRDRTGNRRVDEVDLSAAGTVVHLKGYGFIKVFKIVAPDGDIDYWTTNDLQMTPVQRLQYAEFEWAIEEYHRGLKQCCGVEKAQVRSSRAQRNHIGLAIRAFLRLETHWFNTGISWYEAKISIVREAVRSYLASPWLTLSPTA